jgi:hypothetical protein
MKIRLRISRLLVSRGLFDDQAAMVLDHYAPLGTDMRKRLDDDEAVYPKQMIGIIWMGVCVSAVGWLKQHMPKHWALAVFEKELEPNTSTSPDKTATPEAESEAKDTTYGMKLEPYLKFVKQEGFEELLRIPFDGMSGYKEMFFIFFHWKEGILLKFDTFSGNGVNGGNFCYNWKPKPEFANEDKDGNLPYFKYLSTAHVVHQEAGRETIVCGNHDCREDLCKNLRNLRKYGDFVSPWIERPFLWLLHYMDVKKPGYNYNALNAERIKLLPEDVQKLLG